MLFDRNIEPSCAYCQYGTDMGRNEIICVKNGIMADFGSCGAFRYDPTKRVPEVKPGLDASEWSEEDFSL